MGRWAPDAAGRLVFAAFRLFDERGYDDTTVADIAAAAGLTQRTYFRYFADKREVLFHRSAELSEVWSDAVAAAPPETDPLAAVEHGLDAVSALFTDSLAFARMRAGIIHAHPHLLERELVKLQSLAIAIQDALTRRGVEVGLATVSAQCGVALFHVAFSRWVGQDDPPSLGALIDEAFAELRAVAGT